MTDSTINILKKAFFKIAVLLFWLAIWQAIYLVVQNNILIPAPLEVLSRLKELVLLRSFWVSLLFTISRVFAGVCLALVLGTALGLLSGLNRFYYEILSPLVVAIKSTPIMSFIIVALVWFGSGSVPVFICFLIAFPIIWTNIWEGINNVNVKLLEMARVYRVPKAKILIKIYLPEIKPYFISGFLTIIGMGWKAAVTAEVLSHPVHAIGSRLYDARVLINSVDLFAFTLSIIGISLLIENIIIRLFADSRGNRINSVN